MSERRCRIRLRLTVVLPGGPGNRAVYRHNEIAFLSFLLSGPSPYTNLKSYDDAKTMVGIHWFGVATVKSLGLQPNGLPIMSPKCTCFAYLGVVRLNLLYYNEEKQLIGNLSYSGV
ncbi:hypothetical protein M8C21_020673, partial [Ambrosia artemisiifolia]